MKYIVIFVILVAGIIVWLRSNSTPSTSATAPAAAQAALSPKERMKLLAESMDMELQMFVDGGGGNVTFGVRISKDNTRTAADFLEAAKREMIIRDAEQIATAVTADNFKGSMTETQFQGSLVTP